MLLDPGSWALAHRLDDLLPVLSAGLTEKVSAETHACTLELNGGIHTGVRTAVQELLALGGDWQTSSPRTDCGRRSPDAPVRCRRRHGDLRERALPGALRQDAGLARREPTFALHVHVGVPDPELAMRAADRIRAHLPLILAASANSPFWPAATAHGLVPDPALSGLPPFGHPTPLRQLRGVRGGGRPMMRADALPEPTSSGGTCACSRDSARSRSASSTRRRRSPTRGAVRADPVAGPARGQGGLRPALAGRCRRGARGEPLPGGARRHRRAPHRRDDRFARARCACSSRSSSRCASRIPTISAAARSSTSCGRRWSRPEPSASAPRWMTWASAGSSSRSPPPSSMPAPSASRPP